MAGIVGIMPGQVWIFYIHNWTCRPSPNVWPESYPWGI